MLVANLMLALLWGQLQGTGGEPDRDPATLVAQLGAKHYAERELAATALEQLGRAALPALRAARDSRDLEIRTRVLALTHKIEGALLTRPTRVRLDFKNVPLTEAVRMLGQQAGFKLALVPENLPRYRALRVTLHESDPVDFWKAVDQLREIAGLQYNPGMSGYAGQREPAFSQADGLARLVTPISDHGPFRVSLLGLHYQRDVNFDAAGQSPKVPPRPVDRPFPPAPLEIPAQPEPVATVQFSARLLVAAEPRLAINQNGPLQILEAVDNRGNSLVPIAGVPVFNRYAGYFGFASGPVLQLQTQLHRPESAGETIKKFRGMIPLSISARQPDPLVVSLTNGPGKTVENSEVQLTVHDIRLQPNNGRNTLVEISVRSNDPGAVAETGSAAGFTGLLQRTDPQHLQIEVVDSQGHLIPWFPSGADAETSRITLTLTSPPQATQPKELRYYTLVRAAMSVPFEFNDLPMP